MPSNMKKSLAENKLKRLKRFPVVEASIAAVFIVVMMALFLDTRNMPRQNIQRLAKTSGSSALEFNVVNVNPIIAKDFGLSQVAGVLVNDVPRGSARRLVDIKRADVILKYNNVDVQSANHLSYLMSQNKPGDNVSFVISRAGKTLTLSSKIPPDVGTYNFGPRGLNVMVVLVIIALTFTMLFLNVFNRSVSVTLGAVLMLAAGSILGFYNQNEAFDAIKMSPIFIFIGMSVFAIFLEDLRFFEYIAKKIILMMKADKIKVIFALSVLTFVVAAFMDEISIILIIMPITIYTAKGLNFNPIPVVITEIIAANIGGSATAVGDFSNMLIASSTGLTFLDFLIFLTPVCLICLAGLLTYMWFAEFRHMKNNNSPQAAKEFAKKVKEELQAMSMDWDSIKKVLFVLGAVFIAFIILPNFKIHLAPIALGGGFILLAIETDKAKEAIKKINLVDVIFFIALFLIVGGAVYSGLLTDISNVLKTMSMGNKIVYPLLLMWSMAVFTSLMNSGPAAAFFIPIVMHSGFADFTDVVWWALSLGALAGGSACITGTSAGIISQTLVDEMHTAHLDGKIKENLTFSTYSRRGLPVALIFLVISSAYIVFLSLMP
ncbi:MAG: PDZ domain-containing protein [Candidatus Omnitrophica bacterium]|nr:PDZ domain-containing protein [Candidatus Omnitrophota bacterium]